MFNRKILMFGLILKQHPIKVICTITNNYNINHSFIKFIHWFREYVKVVWVTFRSKLWRRNMYFSRNILRIYHKYNKRTLFFLTSQFDFHVRWRKDDTWKSKVHDEDWNEMFRLCWEKNVINIRLLRHFACAISKTFFRYIFTSVAVL